MATEIPPQIKTDMLDNSFLNQFKQILEMQADAFRYLDLDIAIC